MEILPALLQRSLQRAFKLRDQLYDQVEEAQDVVQDVTDFIVHCKNNKKDVRAILQQRTQDLERELEDETAEKASYQAALAAREAELRCLRPELLQLQQQLAGLSNLCTADPQQPAPTILPGDTLESALRKVGSMITCMGAVLGSTQQQLCDEQAAHGKTRVELQQSQALLSSSWSAHSATQALLGGEQTAHAATRQQLQQAQEAKAAARAAAAQAQADAEALRQQLRQIRAEVGSLSRERAASQTAAACAKADLRAAHQQQLQQVQAELQHERGKQAADLRAAAVQAEADLQATMGQVRASLQAEIGQVQAGLQAERQRHTATQAAVTRLREELEGERRLAAAQHSAAKAAHTRQLQGLVQQLADARAREAALQEDLAASLSRVSDEEGDGSSTTDSVGDSDEEDDEEHMAPLRALERVLLPTRHTPSPGTLADCLATLLEAIEPEEEAYDEECEEEFVQMAAEEGYTLDPYWIFGRGGHATTYRAHKTGHPDQMVAIRFEDKQRDILETLRDAVVEALSEAQSEVTRAVEMLAHAHSNSLAVGAMGIKGVVAVHRARLQETSPGEPMRLMTVMSIAGTQTVQEWVRLHRAEKYPNGYEHFLRLCLIIICQVAQTLASLERRNYHGVDFKVDNVLVSPGDRGCRPVLIDCFDGWSSDSDSTKMLRLGVRATYMWAAPEVLSFVDKLQANSTLTERDLRPSDLSRADVWCLGVALAEMLYPAEGWMPFGHECRASVQQAQRQWFQTRGGPGAKPLSDILDQCAKENVSRNLTELVEEVLRSCWEKKDKRCRVHQLAATMQKRLRL